MGFLGEVETRGIYAENVQKYPNLDYVLIDLSNEAEAGDIGTEAFMELMKVTRESVTLKKRPSVFLRADTRITPMRPGLLNKQSNKFSHKLAKETLLKPVKDLE